MLPRHKLCLIIRYYQGCQSNNNRHPCFHSILSQSNKNIYTHGELNTKQQDISETGKTKKNTSIWNLSKRTLLTEAFDILKPILKFQRFYYINESGVTLFFESSCRTRIDLIFLIKNIIIWSSNTAFRNQNLCS